MAENLKPRFLRWSLLIMAGALALGAGLYFGARVNTPGAGLAGADASALLGVALPDVSGKQEALAQWKGKVLVVNFWATWCTPCREEMPEFVAAQRELGGRGLQFVGIAIDDADKVRQYAQEIGLNYPALIGGYGGIELSRTLGNHVGALPFTVVVDRSGRIAHTQLGPLRDARLRGILDQLL
jgi:thiol-disulfide isomerase/thioredoxin